MFNLFNKRSKKAVVRRYYEEVINTGNTDDISGYIDNHYMEVFQEQRYEIGIAGAIEHVVGLRKTYPDLHITIDRQICEGDWVATTYLMTGTHTGKWMGIKPTHKKVKISGVSMDRVVGGKIVEHDGAANIFEALLELEIISIVRETKS